MRNLPRLNDLIDNLYYSPVRAEYNIRCLIGETVQKIRDRVSDIDNVFFDKVGIYRGARVSVANTAYDLKRVYDIGRDAMRAAATEPKWRNFLLTRGGISVASSTVGLFAGSTIDLSGSSDFVDQLRHAMPAVGPSLGTRIILEAIGARFVYEANREQKFGKFAKRYLKVQLPIYAIDFLSSPFTLVLVRSLGAPDNASVYLNGKVTAIPVFTWNVVRYKKEFIDKTKRMLNGYSNSKNNS